MFQNRTVRPDETAGSCQDTRTDSDLQDKGIAKREYGRSDSDIIDAMCCYDVFLNTK